jgi:hypothetical protein
MELENQMSEKQTTFTVTDRRKFTLDGELRDPSTAASVEEEVRPPQSAEVNLAAGTPQPTPGATTSAGQSLAVDPDPAGPALANPTLEDISHDEAAGAPSEDDLAEDDLGPLPTVQETADQQAAYQQTSGHIDDMIRQANPGAPASIEINFEQVVQSFYLSAVVAMGAAAEPGQQPRVDIIGARQSIDLLAVLVEKTKGNLTEREEKLLQTALFNLRMMFLEITNTIAAQATRPQQPGNPSRKK